MSAEIESKVRDLLKQVTYTRVGTSDFSTKDLEDLEAILKETKANKCEEAVLRICDDNLAQVKDNIVALYLSGMILISQGSINTQNLVTLCDIFEKNHKEPLIEHMCEKILEGNEDNKFALKKLADYYKKNNDDRVWDLYEKIIRIDLEEADYAKALAERYEFQNNREAAITFYKKALLRYVATKNQTSIKTVWSKLVQEIPEDLDYFLRVQGRIAKTISADRSATLLQELYSHYKKTDNYDTAIYLLKIMLNIDSKDSWARSEITECYRSKYASHTRLEDYIMISNLDSSVRDVNEAIADFERHIAFDAKNYVYHRTWGVGVIKKVEGDKLTINFGKKNGIHEMDLSLAVKALQPLAKDHIWVLKATKQRDVLKEEFKKNINKTLKIIIRSFDNDCDEKKIKAELVPSIFTPGEWTSWHLKAKKELSSDPTFSVNPNNSNNYTVRDKPLTPEERLANEFKAEKDFFSRIDILCRFLKDIEDTSDELFSDMFMYFAGFAKSFEQIKEQNVAAFLVCKKVTELIPNLEVNLDYTFADLYNELEKPLEMFLKLKDTKNTTLKADFITCVRSLPNWEDEYTKLFPVVLDKKLITEIVSSGNSAKAVEFVRNAFTNYKTNRNAVVYLFKECSEEEWYKNADISYEKQLVTLINIIGQCYHEIDNSLNTVENKKTAKNATQLLFENKSSGTERNILLDYILDKNEETIGRFYTLVSDVAEIESEHKLKLRQGILAKNPDFKFQEAEIKHEAPKGLLVTKKMHVVKKAEADDMEKVQLPKITQEISDAKEKGDLKENAEYISAREAKSRLSDTLAKLKGELARAVEVDPETVTTAYVSFGTKVTLQNNIENKEETYTIFGPWESNPEEGIISYLSPLGASLMDMKAGETKKFKINDREHSYTVKSITAVQF